MKAILFGVTPTDWRPYATMSLLLTIVALRHTPYRKALGNGRPA
jgi:hypothetical protein